GRTGDVRPLADHDETGVLPDLERLQAAEPGPRRRRRDLARRRAADGGGDARDVRWRRPAAATDDVDHAGRGELADQPAGLLGALVVAAERVRQAGVGVA